MGTAAQMPALATGSSLAEGLQRSHSEAAASDSRTGELGANALNESASPPAAAEASARQTAAGMGLLSMTRCQIANARRGRRCLEALAVLAGKAPAGLPATRRGRQKSPGFEVKFELLLRCIYEHVCCTWLIVTNHRLIIPPARESTRANERASERRRGREGGTEGGIQGSRVCVREGGRKRER